MLNSSKETWCKASFEEFVFTVSIDSFWINSLLGWWALRDCAGRPRHLLGYIFYKEALLVGIPPPVYETFVSDKWSWVINKKWVEGADCVRERPTKALWHTCNEQPDAATPRLAGYFLHPFLCFDHGLFLTRSIPLFVFPFLFCPSKPVSSSVKTQLGHSSHSTWHSHLFMLHP